ncbi:unnamed protein product [Brassica oleracea var. botrytis]
MGFHVINSEAESTTHARVIFVKNTPLLGFVIFFSLRHQKLSSPTKSMDSDASPPLFKCGCSGFRRNGKLMGVDMLYWIQRLLCFEACVHNYLNFLAC